MRILQERAIFHSHLPLLQILTERTIRQHAERKGGKDKRRTPKGEKKRKRAKANPLAHVLEHSKPRTILKLKSPSSDALIAIAKRAGKQ